MAGIGFDLLKLWKRGSYQSLMSAYGMTTLMGSGPSIFIILSIGVISFFTFLAEPASTAIRPFLAFSVYLFSASMISSALLQYTFFRYMADKILLKEFELITPNFIGILLSQSIISLCFALPIVFFVFAEYSLIMKLVLLANYLILCFIWLSTVFLTGLKTYRRIIWAFLVSYGVMLISYFLFDKQEVVYLLFEFLLAQTLLFILLLHAILDFYPTQELIRFDFFQKGNLYPGLIFSNFLYTLAVWVDKYLFWFHPDTGVRLGPALHVSPLYDVPMFIAYLSIIPATSVFLLQIEANFAMVYPRFMETIFKRKNLDEINAMRDQLVLSGRDCILSLFKTQAMVVIIILLSAMAIFRLLGVVPVYINLLFILVVAAGLNVILWGLLNILYYMTRYQQAVWVNVLLCVSNLLFTALSLYLGPQYFGYGFALSVLLAIGLALHFLNKNFQELEYSTFMLID